MFVESTSGSVTNVSQQPNPIGISLYLVWILAVIALVVIRLMPGPVTEVISQIVAAGAAIATVFGLILIIYRIPKYIRRFRESLFR